MQVNCQFAAFVHQIKFFILLPKYRRVVNSLVGQPCLESQGSNRIGYVTELLITEHHPNSVGACDLTPTQECKHCALIQLRNERCVLRICLFRFLCSHYDIVLAQSNLLHWQVYTSLEALLVLILITIGYRQEKAFCD